MLHNIISTTKLHEGYHKVSLGIFKQTPGVRFNDTSEDACDSIGIQNCYYLVREKDNG